MSYNPKFKAGDMVLVNKPSSPHNKMWGRVIAFVPQRPTFYWGRTTYYQPYEVEFEVMKGRKIVLERECFDTKNLTCHRMIHY